MRAGTPLVGRVLLGLLLAALIGGVIAWVRPEPLPSYNGRTVAQWFNAFDLIGSYLREPLQKSPDRDAAYCVTPLLAALACHGTNAAVFAPEIRALAESGTPALTNLAAHTLARVTSGRSL